MEKPDEIAERLGAVGLGQGGELPVGEVIHPSGVQKTNKKSKKAAANAGAVPLEVRDELLNYITEFR